MIYCKVAKIAQNRRLGARRRPAASRKAGIGLLRGRPPRRSDNRIASRIIKFARRCLPLRSPDLLAVANLQPRTELRSTRRRQPPRTKLRSVRRRIPQGAKARSVRRRLPPRTERRCCSPSPLEPKSCSPRISARWSSSYRVLPRREHATQNLYLPDADCRRP
nr:hypothetical protein Iba_chr14fCG7550 [Ipomoea batatas]